MCLLRFVEHEADFLVTLNTDTSESAVTQEGAFEFMADVVSKIEIPSKEGFDGLFQV